MNIEARKYQLIEKIMQFDEIELKKIEAYLKDESALVKSLYKALQQAKEGKVIPQMK